MCESERVELVVAVGKKHLENFEKYAGRRVMVDRSDAMEHLLLPWMSHYAEMFKLRMAAVAKIESGKLLDEEVERLEEVVAGLEQSIRDFTEGIFDMQDSEIRSRVVSMSVDDLIKNLDEEQRS